MTRHIYRFLDRTLAVMEVVFGAGTLFGLCIGVIAGPEQTRPLERILGIPVMLAIYLVKRLHDISQNSTVMPAQQLS